MAIPTKKLKNGFELPELGLGTWRMGGGKQADYSKDDFYISAIKKAIDMGYTHIDTAACYGNGHTEELVNQAIKDYPRNSLIIASKVTNEYLRYDDLLKSANNSIKRFGVNYSDLFYIHAPNPDVPIKDTMRAMDKLVSDGLVKNIAVSNFTVEQLKKTQAHTKNKIVANQIEYSLLTREQGKYGSQYASNSAMESKTVPYCQKNDIFIVAERPLERGILLEKNDIMEELSQKYNKTYAQLAINWLVSQKNVITIPKAESEEHLKDNLGGVGWYMDDEDVEKLRKEYNTL